MPTTKTITLYQYDELPTDEAKEKAREWFMSGDAPDLQFTCDNFLEVCNRIGLELETRKYSPQGAKSIWYQISGSQSDFATFEGSFQPKKGALSQIKDEYPQDEKLHSIAERVEALLESNPECEARLTTTHRSRKVSVEIVAGVDDDPVDYDQNCFALENEVEDIVKDLQEWFFKELQDDWSHQLSQEHVEENIRINNYTFREDGRRED
jgi:hypothetical protein